MFRRAFRTFSRLAVAASLATSSLIYSGSIPEFDEYVSLSKAGLAQPNSNDSRTFVVIGDGPAAFVCVHSLRAGGYTGKIVLLSPRSGLPVNRLLFGKPIHLSHLQLGSDQFYAAASVDVHADAHVKSVCTKTNTVHLQDGTHVTYDKLCVALEKDLKVSGELQGIYKNLDNVITLDSLEDHQRFIEATNTCKSLVVSGMTFETLECIAALPAETRVTVFDTNDEPLDKLLGHEIAALVLGQLRARGVRLVLGNSPNEFVSNGTHLTAVKVTHHDEFRGRISEEIPTDLLVISNATHVNTSFVPPNLLSRDGTIPVDQFMRSRDTKVYAAGAAVNYLDLWTEHRASPERLTAAVTGAYAANNMLHHTTPYIKLPVNSLRVPNALDLIGNTADHDWYWTETISNGDVNQAAKVTYFYRQGKCIGAVVYNHAGIGKMLAKAIEEGFMPSPNHLVHGHGLMKILASLDK